jgi:molybdopterin molybdotransferase
MQPLIDPSSAFCHISSSLPVMGQELCQLENASGRVLRQPISADRPVPPFDRAMMDGIAIDSRGHKTQWAISGIQAAGEAARTLSDSSQCFEIMTGAMLPVGCDTVIPIENIELIDGTAKLSAECDYTTGDFIHPCGSDHQTGTTLVKENTLLTAPELAIAASCGVTELTVSKLPRITLITSGDEVVTPSSTPEPFQIRASHATAIRSIVEKNTLGELTHLHILDDQNSTRESIQAAISNSDVLILTGGVSKGKFDYIAPVLRELAGPPLFHGVSQRPGKPLAYFSADISIFALPGNPLSVMACMARYVVPALKQMLGIQQKEKQLPLASSGKTFPHLTHLLASKVINGELHPSTPNNSGDYAALLGCNGVIEIPPSTNDLPSGTTCTFYPW